MYTCSSQIKKIISYLYRDSFLFWGARSARIYLIEPIVDKFVAQSIDELSEVNHSFV